MSNGPHGDFDDDFDDDCMMIPDMTSMRTHAFTELLRTANSIRDAKLKAEAILMLQTVRSTIHVPPRGQLVVFQGGKTEVCNDDTDFEVGSGKLEVAAAPPPKKTPARPRTPKK